MNIIKDKLRLVTLLTPEEIKRIKSLYPAKKNNPFFYYSYYQFKPNFFAVWIHPKEHYVLRHYNAMLSFNPANHPIEALEIFNMIEPERWKVSRLDIAFDFSRSYEDCFLLPPPTSIKIKRKFTTFYYGAVNSRCSVCQYDKQKQLRQVKQIESLPMTRIEFRLKPKLKPITEYARQDFIKMKGFHFVPSTHDITGFRSLLKSITNGKREWKELVRKDREKVTVAVKARVKDMLELFLEYIEGDINTFLLDSLSASLFIDEPCHQNVG
jgi:hypothetical protein